MDPDVEEWNTRSADTLGRGFKLYSVSVVVAEYKELVEFFFPMGPDEEDVINVAVPHQRFLLASLQQVFFDKSHEEVSIGRCHFGPHCCATLLEIVSITKPKYVAI